MKKHKVEDLTGGLLDAAVAKAIGQALMYEVVGDPERCMVDGQAYAPSSDWAIGGPIIEREQISILVGSENQPGHECWTATIPFEGRYYFDGPYDADIEMISFDGPLVAAMRAFVASKFGETIDI